MGGCFVSIVGRILCLFFPQCVGTVVYIWVGDGMRGRDCLYDIGILVFMHSCVR